VLPLARPRNNTLTPTRDALIAQRACGRGGTLCRLLTVKAGGTAVLAQYVGEQRYTKLRDFSDHLLDITVDWLNPELTQ